MPTVILNIYGYDPLVPDTWVTPENLAVEDGYYTNYGVAPDTPTTYMLGVATEDQIPVGASIIGVSLRIRRFNPDGLDHHDYSVYIMNASTLDILSNNYADPDAWPNGVSDEYYGGDEDLWGSSEITADLINSGNFAIGFRGIKIGGSLWTWFNLDYFEITINYTGGGEALESVYGPAIQSI